MILMNASLNLAAPDPASAQFVAVAPFVEQNVAGLKPKLIDLGLCRPQSS